ncbi:MAG: putative nitrogen fixation protein NifT [Zoogloea sp.]|nr:putative nitrogen fixation protein NifT [Zoogloea sp.]
MKVMLRNTAQGLSAYVPKKDLEEPVVSQEKDGLWGGTITLANGWVLALPEMQPDTRLPITVEARKVGGE